MMYESTTLRINATQPYQSLTPNELSLPVVLFPVHSRSWRNTVYIQGWQIQGPEVIALSDAGTKAG